MCPFLLTSVTEKGLDKKAKQNYEGTKVSEGIFYFGQKYKTHAICCRVNLFPELCIVIKELHTRSDL